MRIIGNDPSVPRQTQEVASGTLPNGKPIVVNADGTVSSVAETTDAGGTPVAFDSGTIRFTSVAYDTTNQKIVIAYEDSSNNGYGTAIVGTVNSSDNSISFGTAVVFESAEVDQTRIAYDANAGKFVIAYSDQGNSHYGTAIVGTVSGTSISFGTATVFESANTDYISVVYDSNAQKVVVSYSDGGDSSNGKSIVGTVSGTSISFGSAQQFGNANSYDCTSVFDSTNNKVVALWRDINDSNKGKAKVGTVSGTSISFAGSEVTFEAGAAEQISADFDTSSGKVIIAFSDSDNSNKGTAIVGTVSGNDISFGTAVIFNDASTTFTTTTYNPVANKTFIAFKDAGNSNYLTAIVGTVSGTSISFGSETVLDQVNGLELGSAYDSSQDRIVVSYRNSTDSEGSSVVFRVGSANLTSENYIGMSSGPVSPSVLGTELTYVSENASENILAFDSSNNKVVFAYTDGSNSPQKGVAVVANVSGTTMTAGSAVTFANVDTSMGGMAFDSSNNKIVIAYRDGSDTYGKAVVGTVSGTSISFGSPVTFKSGNTNNIDCCFDSNANKIYISFGYNNTGIGIVGTVSGTSISFGSEQVWIGSEATYIKNTFDSSNNKVVTVYRDAGGAGYGKAIVGTISGTSVSYGSPTAFNSGNTSYTNAEFDSVNNKVVIFFQQSTYKAIVATVSGTSISFGSEVEWSSVENFGNFGASFDPTLGKMIVIYKTTGNITASKQGTVSGTSISFSDQQDNITSGQVYTPRITYDTNSKVSVLVYRLTTNSNYGTTRVYNPEIRGQVADGGHALIDTQGAISDNQSGLTAGQSYFVQTDGTIGTTADDPSVFAGTAVSATKLIVKG